MQHGRRATERGAAQRRLCDRLDMLTCMHATADLGGATANLEVALDTLRGRGAFDNVARFGLSAGSAVVWCQRAPAPA